MNKGKMAPNENIDRNKELIQKRLDDPKKWSFGALGLFYNIHKTTAENVFKRDIEKYATKKQIERYEKYMIIKPVGSYPQ